MAITTMNASSLTTKIRKLSLAISLVLASLTTVMIPTIQSAHADNSSCDEGKLYPIEIDELNDSYPHRLTLIADSDYYQLVGDKGRVIQDKLYDVSAYEDGRIIAKRHGYFGAIDADGKVVLDFKHDAIEVFNNDFYQLTKYFGDKKATAVTNGSGDWIYPASKAFDKNTQVSYLYSDKTNNTSYFMVSTAGKHGLINDKKQTLIAPVYDQLELLDTCPNERLFMKAILGDKVGLIDQHQKVVVPFAKNTDIESFNEDKQIFSIKSYAPQASGNMDHLNIDTITSESLIDGKGTFVIKSDASMRLLHGDLYEYKKSDKYGIIDNSGNIVLPADFDYLYSQYSQYNAPILATQNQRVGIITKDSQGKLGIETFYDELELNHYNAYTLSDIENLALKNDDHSNNEDISNENISSEEEVSYDSTNTEAVVQNADSSLKLTSYNPENNSYIARINRRFGIVDSHNKVLIPIIYDEISDLNHFIKVKKDNKYGLLSADNKIIKPLIYDDISPLSDSHGTDENIAIVFTKDGQQQLTDNFGSVLMPFADYRFVDNKLDYLDNMSVIEKDGKYGLYSVKDKKIIIQPIYEDMYDRIYNDSILAQLNGKKVLIDTSGKILIDNLSQYAEIKRSNNENTIIVKTKIDKYGVIDYKGNIIIPTIYDSLELKTLAKSYNALWGENKDPILIYIVGKNGKYGAFKHNGDVVVPIEYAYLQPIMYPPYLIVDKSDNKYTENTVANNSGLVDLSGQLVLSMNYHNIIINPYDPEGRLYAINTDNNTVETYDKSLKLINTQSLQAFKDSSDWYEK